MMAIAALVLVIAVAVVGFLRVLFAPDRHDQSISPESKRDQSWWVNMSDPGSDDD